MVVLGFISPLQKKQDIVILPKKVPSIGWRL